MSIDLFAPLFIYILWVGLLYLFLTIVRAPVIWGDKSAEQNSFSEIEPRVSANLSNQFEWPVLFFAVCVILLARPEFYQVYQLWLAWVFVVGRMLHSIVQVFTTNLRLRGSVFNINFLAVLGMWGLLAIRVLGA